MVDELTIEETNRIVSLEQAIIEGTDALIPFTFEFPETDLTVEVGLKPITLSVLREAPSNLSDTEVVYHILGEAVFNMDGTAINNEVLSKVPVGILNQIINRISEISGLNLNNIQPRLDVNQLENFP